MSLKVVTLDSLLQAKFVTIRAVCEDSNADGYDVHLQPTNDHATDVRVHVSRDKAIAMGLSLTS